jgi:hypothetical protein
MIATSSGKPIIATDRLLGRSTSGTGPAEEISLGTGLSLSGGTLSNTATLSGTGSTDNAILRADGTGGATLQNSGLIVEDTIVSVTGITGVASTNTITAPGTAFANGQPIRFTALTGGTGLNTTTNYFVVNVSGTDFQVETSIGGGAINFTTNITAGTLLTGHSVQVNVTLSENTTETNSALVLTPKGSGAFILGRKPDGTAVGGNARGARAVDLQTSRTAAAQVASGSESFTAGTACLASGIYSVAIGRSNTSSGTASVALGVACSASGQNSFVSGWGNVASGIGAATWGGTNVSGNSASSSFSTVLGGLGGLSNRYAMHSHSAGAFSAQGDAQRARFVMRRKTTDATPTELFLDGASVRLTIPSGKVLGLTINITGIKSNGSAVAHYLRQYALKNVAGTCTEVYAPVTIGTDNAAGTTIALSANDTNDALKVEVTGITSEIWRWVASVDAVEIAYGI